MSQSVAMVNETFKKRAITWLVTAVVMLVVWLAAWLLNGTPQASQDTKAKEVTTQDFALPKSIDSFEQFTKEVPPVDFSAVVRDLRSYPKEFKDKRFFQQHSKRWTVQVMDVAQNDIVTGYLNGRSDREKFTYFRYRNSDNEIRYVLTYGIMGSTQEAIGAIKTVDFNLPKNVKPVPEQMQRYLDIIDNYEHHEEIVDASPSSPRAVKLQKTRTEIPAVAPKEKPKKNPEKETNKSKTSENKNKERAKKSDDSPPKPKRESAAQQEAPKKQRAENNTELPKPKPQPKPESKPKPEAIEPTTNTAKVPGSDL